MTDNSTKPAIGLALSGGATFGAAHVGVIRALEEQSIRIGWVAGTSIGAVVGALYAFDVPVGEIESIVRHSSWMNLTRFAPSRLGLLSNSKLGRTLTDKLGDVNLEDAPRPFAVIAVDIRTGEKLTLRQGNLARAVMASACIPGIFAPVQWEDRLLVDGGIIENLPIDTVRQLGAERAVGVILRARFPYPHPKTVIDIVINAGRILVYNTARAESGPTQVIIAPELTVYSSMDTGHMPEMIEEGYRATQQAADDIRRLLK